MKTQETMQMMGRTVQELAAGLSRGDYNGSERFLSYSPERAASEKMLRMLKLVVMMDLKMPKNWNFNDDGEPTTEESDSDAVARFYNDLLKTIVEAEAR